MQLYRIELASSLHIEVVIYSIFTMNPVRCADVPVKDAFHVMGSMPSLYLSKSYMARTQKPTLLG